MDWRCSTTESVAMIVLDPNRRCTVVPIAIDGVDVTGGFCTIQLVHSSAPTARSSSVSLAMHRLI